MKTATMRNVFWGIDIEGQAGTSYEAVQVLTELYVDLIGGKK